VSFIEDTLFQEPPYHPRCHQAIATLLLAQPRKAVGGAFKRTRSGLEMVAEQVAWNAGQVANGFVEPTLEQFVPAIKTTVKLKKCSEG
jgi:hypothetical protein